MTSTPSTRISWQSLLKPYRIGPQGTYESAFDKMRSPFLQDCDRILFSHSFRMLARKTQVHPLSSNDHVHHRQTHSLEVSSVARSLGIMAGYFVQDRGELPENVNADHIGQIVQAAGLAHDLGNPPFGHGGEAALQDWFKGHAEYLEPLTEEQKADFLSFDGNAQSFRVVTALENYRDKGGLRLTFPTIATLVKYPRSAYRASLHGTTKFNFYSCDAPHFDEIFTKLGLKAGERYMRHPLSYLAEAADDICYLIIDIEDAMELSIISEDVLLETVAPIRHRLGLTQERLDSLTDKRRRTGAYRARIIAVCIDAIFDAFTRCYDRIMNGDESVENLIKHCDDEVLAYFENARNLFFNVILRNHSKTAFEIGAYQLYSRILDTFIPAVNHAVLGKKTRRDEHSIALMGDLAPGEHESLYMAYVRVIDYITSMTDPTASFLSRQLAGILSQ